MLVFDQLKKDDPQLRFLAVMVLAGILILLGGLWWVQVVSSRYYQEKLETQSIRTVRIPAVRGKILDRDGRPLAENLPSYKIDLYIEELSKNYQTAYATALTRTRNYVNQQIAEKQKQLGRKLTVPERKPYIITEAYRAQLQQVTRYQVTSNLVADLSARLQEPVPFPETRFQSQYQKARALPMPILSGLSSAQVARFEEQSINMPGMEMEVQSIRSYPNGQAAAHLLGYLRHDNDSDDGEVADYNYRLADFVGASGIEKLFDKELRGAAGSKSVLVNNLGYRQGETVLTPSEPGQNVVLTIDLDIQKAAEAALQSGPADVRGAVVVMDVRNGDVLALASAPFYNPNHFVQHPEAEAWEREWERWTNGDLQVQMNHAMQGEYAPGSIFKIVVGLAALEQGVLNPEETFHSLGYFPMPGRKPIKDTAGAGEFNFDKALALSSNPYFITQGLKPGVLPKIVALGQRLHFGERTGALPKQEDRGYFPSQKDIASSSWRDGSTANLSIGQDKIAVTPLQIAVMTSAVANGGKIYYPRLVSRVESPDGTGDAETFPEGRLRDTLGVSQRSLGIVHKAMLADVESETGTGRGAAVPGLHIAGKTGTAEVEKNGHIDKGSKITWFASFAPAAPTESPHYCVIAMVESGISGGKTCAPIANKVYLAIQQKEQERERRGAPKAESLARTQ
ncbi:MAG: Penicillin-binding protein 2 [Pedosphaera sp.]|nr:Penicillin-binding protein 2 [Pedosphaera sp.]